MASQDSGNSGDSGDSKGDDKRALPNWAIAAIAVGAAVLLAAVVAAVVVFGRRRGTAAAAAAKSRRVTFRMPPALVAARAPVPSAAEVPQVIPALRL